MILATAALCLAINIFHESRGEPVMGQYAVALVTLNRAGGDHDKVCEVVKARKQFSWTTGLVKSGKVVPKGLPRDEDAWNKAQIIANVTLSGRMRDFTKGSTFYHATRVRPYWTSAMVMTKQVGRHIFYRQDRYVIADLYKGRKS
ncbi:cell wall hydrolase [Polaromonas sp. P1(28)-13]|nr:cell wall hydrolase [Polaromonas sp. P1(28)-13]